MELFLNNLLFQLYVIEFLSRSMESSRSTLKNCLVKKNVVQINRWLGELKYLRQKRVLFLKRIIFVNTSKKKQRRNIYCIVDLLIQQLFVIVLNSRVKANTELNNYNSDSHLFLVKSVSKSRNSLCYKLFLKNVILEPPSLDTCFHLLNYILLLKHIFVPLKYEYIFKSWLCVKQVKYLSSQTNKKNLKICLIGILGFLWTNSVFNALYRLIYGIVVKSKINMCDNSLRKFSSNALKLFFHGKPFGNLIVERFICWDFFWGIKGFAVLSNSRKFLSLLARKVQSFFLMHCLKMQVNIYRIIWVRGHSNFHFIRSIFSGNTEFTVVKKRLRLPVNKIHEFQFQRKLLFNSFSAHMNFLKFFYVMHGAVSWHYSVYNIILVLNNIVIKWMDYSMVNFQKIGGFVKFWLSQWLLFWVERRYGKKFKIFLSKHSLFVKYLGFHNHLETLRHLTKINCIFLTRNFFFGFVEVSKQSFKHLYVAVPKITTVWGLFSF